jgi:Cyclin, N-terminal domain
MTSSGLCVLMRLDADFIIQNTIDVVSFAFSSSPPSNRSPDQPVSDAYTAFTEFASNVVKRSDVPVTVLLVALVYINRARPYLHIETEDYAYERVFLGAIVLASKVCLFFTLQIQWSLTHLSFQYTNDSSLKNTHWALATGVWGKRDVGRVEREMLDVLDWDLAVSESDILAYHESITDPLLTRRQHHHSYRLSQSDDSSSPTTQQPDVQEEDEDDDNLTWTSDEDDDNESPLPQTPQSLPPPPRSTYAKSSHHPLVQPHKAPLKSFTYRTSLTATLHRYRLFSIA